MSALRPNLGWLIAAISVLLGAGGGLWLLQSGGDRSADRAESGRSPSGITSSGSEPGGGAVLDGTPDPATTGAPPGIEGSGEGATSSTDGSGVGATSSTDGPPAGRSPGKVGGNGGPPGSDPEDSVPGQPSGVRCWGGAERTPLSPIRVDGTTIEVRNQVAANLQLLREISPPPTLAVDVEGLRSYYRRASQVVGADGPDVSLRTEQQGHIERLTQDVYARFAPAVIGFLSRRC